MSYSEKIKELIEMVPETLVDLNAPRVRGRAPTQAFSEFLTNREQGDWAERLVLNAINEFSKNFIAVQYGKSENKVAGEDGFNDFYESYQDELDEIGKRPDILVFKKEDYHQEWEHNISTFSREELNEIVPKAIAGLEVRSSSFLIEKYDAEMQARFERNKTIALEVRDEILRDYRDLLSNEWISLLESINDDNLGIIQFRTPSKRSTKRLLELTTLFQRLKEALTEIQKRDFLSITPKAEDIKVVYKWVQTYNVPHFYFQVFFDKVYGISFEQILEIISDPANEEKTFYVESGDSKNQNKTTFKINSKAGREIAHRIDMPLHNSRVRELMRGRLLFYVTFEGGQAYLNARDFLDLLQIQIDEF